MNTLSWQAQQQRSKTLTRLAKFHFVAAFFALIIFFPIWTQHMWGETLVLVFIDFNNFERHIDTPVLLAFFLAILFIFAIFTGIGLLLKSPRIQAISRFMPLMTVPLWLVFAWQFAQAMERVFIASQCIVIVVYARNLWLAVILLLPVWILFNHFYQRVLQWRVAGSARKIGIRAYFEKAIVGVIILALLIEFRMADGRRFIHDATSYGWAQVVAALLHLGQGVNISDDRDNTPLHFAARSGQVATLDYLLHSGADINAKNSTGDTPAITAALSTRTYLPVSRSDGYAAAAMLILRNADVTVNPHGVGTLLDWLDVRPHRSEKLGPLLTKHKFPIEARSADTLLALVVNRGCQEDVDFLLKHGAKMHPLLANHADLQMMEFLLKRGFNVRTKDKEGRTALHWLFSADPDNLEEYALVLVAHGADPNAHTKSGETILDIADSMRSTEAIEIAKALQKGAPYRRSTP